MDQLSKKNYLTVVVAGLVLIVGVGAYLMSGGDTLQGNLRAARSPGITLENNSGRITVESEKKFSQGPAVFEAGSLKVKSISGQKSGTKTVLYKHFNTAITVKYLMPYFNSADAEDTYSTPVSLEICDSDFSEGSCQPILSKEYFNKKNSSESMRYKVWHVQAEEMRDYLKKWGLVKGYGDGNLGLRMKAKDPNNSFIYSDEYILDIPQDVLNYEL